MILACSTVALTQILRLTCSLAVISRSFVIEFVYVWSIYVLWVCAHGGHRGQCQVSSSIVLHLSEDRVFQ